MPTSTALTVTAIENEPRVRDTALAEQLGMARPTNIRSLIEANREEIESFGPCTARVHGHPTVPGRSVTEFWLNRQQALLVCILSKTARAKEVRAEVIRRSRRGRFVLRSYHHGCRP